MAFQYEKDSENIVTLTLDMPGHSANLINTEFGEGFADALKRLNEEEPLAGVIVTSAKKTFLAGADLEMLFALEDPQVVFEGAE